MIEQTRISFKEFWAVTFLFSDAYQHFPVELSVMTEMFYLSALSSHVATSHMSLLSTGNVANVTEELNFNYF